MDSTTDSGSLFGSFLQGTKDLANTYSSVRQIVATPVVQTKGGGQPLIQQGQPAAVQAVAPNASATTTTPTNYTPWLIGGAVVIAAIAAVALLRR